jgi:spore coat protein U-like protein
MNKILSVALAAALFAAGAAQAGTAPASFTVSSTVQSTCAATAAALTFPVYVPGAGALAASSLISVKCTKSTPYTIALSVGSTAGSLFTQRLMTSGGANVLQYNLYTVAAFGTVFGDGTGTTQTVPGTGAGVGTAVQTTVYGQILDSTANQLAVPGNYTDSINVTVTY